MTRLSVSLAAAALAAAALLPHVTLAAASTNGKVKNVVILMEENRSFDHMIGMLKTKNPKIDGCVPKDTDPKCSCPLDPSNPSSPHVYADNKAVYVQPADPDHTIEGTTLQLYGGQSPTVVPVPPMNGFIKSYAKRFNNHTTPAGNPDFIMHCFDPSHVPVITALAEDFALFDRWYAGVPGPTMVNRAYAQSGTSHGMGYNDPLTIALGLPQKSIFGMLDEANVSWGVYFEDLPSSIQLSDARKHLDRFHSMAQFYNDTAAGTLPAVAWLEPRYLDAFNMSATDQHPDHDVAEGEKLMKATYEALRASPLWEHMLFMVTYDEHGGFWSAVPPPSRGVVSPDGIPSTDPPFNFTRLGLRVPTLVASPYVSKGQVLHEPAEGHYEHSSIPETLRKLFAPEQAPLTARAAAAATFDSVLDLEAPRTDCPTHLPAAPTHRGMGNNGLPPLSRLGQNPVPHLGREFVQVAALLTGEGESMTEARLDAMQEGEAAAYVASRMNAYLGRRVVDVPPPAAPAAAEQ